ncbi:hypothetical protein pb186bvf_012630 [Paramecium bursaria]
MSSYNNEKELIGSILSDDDDQPVQLKQGTNSSQSLISTGVRTNKKFFQTQTSIEILSQGSSNPRQLSDQQSIPEFKKPKKHKTIQPNYTYFPDQFFQSDPRIEILSQTDLEQICGNQQVSRKLQNLLESGDEKYKQVIISQFEQNTLKAAKDMFGNYTLQRAFEFGQVTQVQKLYNNLLPFILELSKHPYGCRVVQKMIEFIQCEWCQDQLLKLIFSQIRQLLQDSNGNIVIHCLFDNVAKHKIESLIQFAEEQIIAMSRHTYGCRVIQRIFEQYPSEMTYKLLNNIMTIAPQLCYQEFGNYIIQFILKFGPMKERQVICEIIRDNFEQLSMNKYGSNTVEKYLELMGPHQIVNELFKFSNREFVFFNLSVHPFGNYVIKKVLNFECPPLKQFLRQYPELINRIKMSEYGSRVGQIMESI